MILEILIISEDVFEVNFSFRNSYCLPNNSSKLGSNDLAILSNSSAI